MDRFSTFEDTNLLSSRKQIMFLLYLGIISLILHYAYPSEPIVAVIHSRPFNFHHSLRSPNSMVEGDNFNLDDEVIYDTDIRETFLFLSLIATLIASSIFVLNRGKLKSSINSFLYDSIFGYSPLRSPPSIK